MAAEIELVVGLVKIAEAGDQLSFIVALKASAGHDVEDTISAVPELSAVTSPINLHVVDVLGVELRAQIGSDVGVGHGHTVDQPAGLVASANVQLVVGDVSTGDIVRDHG